jgi:DNA repair protein RadA
MEIFNPSEWNRMKKVDINKAKVTIEHIRERRNLKKFPFSKTLSHKQFNKPIELCSKKFNTLIGTGFNPGYLYLIYGAYATGKTQIGFHACVSLYNMYKELLTPISALFIDTEDTFRPERIQEIAKEAYDLSDTKVFSRIRVLKATSTDMIYTMLKKIDAEGLDKEIKLIVIDSLTKHIRLDLGNEEISNTQVRDKLKRILGYLREITKQHNIVTILNSQVTGFVPENSIFAERPIMEYVLNHYVDETIYLNRMGEERLAHLVNSRNHPNQKVPFTISSLGIED